MLGGLVFHNLQNLVLCNCGLYTIFRLWHFVRVAFLHVHNLWTLAVCQCGLYTICGFLYYVQPACTQFVGSVARTQFVDFGTRLQWLVHNFWTLLLHLGGLGETNGLCNYVKATGAQFVDFVIMLWQLIHMSGRLTHNLWTLALCKSVLYTICRLCYYIWVVCTLCQATFAQFVDIYFQCCLQYLQIG